MLEPKRHSFDIPISRTLVAIMRSRSLRDPDMNSLPRHSLPTSRLRSIDDRSGVVDSISAESPDCKRHSFSCSYYDHLERSAAAHRRCAPACNTRHGRRGRCRIAARMWKDEGDLLGGYETDSDDAALSSQESSRSLVWKYRPLLFSELVGQSAVAQSLTSAAARGEVAPLYLFHGPHGTGKTSAARLFASALNCHGPTEARPCGVCRDCTAILSGKSGSVREIDASKLNNKNRISELLRNAVAPPSSGFWVFVIDDCQDLETEAWRSICSSLDDLPDHAVFIMITANTDKLPSSSVAWCQCYRFAKVEDAFMKHRLKKICTEERLDVEDDVLSLLTRKANGSVRDALVMLDQLTLLGKKITRQLAYELIGDVSDDDLLDLLFLSLSSDAASVVKSARELLSANVDPMQLLAQLANLIMDILAGRYKPEHLEARNIVVTEAHVHQLRNALEVLSETEKQIRASKNQSTWLTAALVQLNMGGSHHRQDNGAASTARYTPDRTDDGCSCTEASDAVSIDRSKPVEMQFDDPEVLERIWSKAVENCSSKPLQALLLQDGKLSSLYFHQAPGAAVACVEFQRLHQDAATDGLLEPLANALQDLLGCNVDMRIRSNNAGSTRKEVRSESQSVSLIAHSSRDPETSELSTEETENESPSKEVCGAAVAASSNVEARIVSYRTIPSPVAGDTQTGQLSRAQTGNAGRRRRCIAKLIRCLGCCNKGRKEELGDRPRRRRWLKMAFPAVCCSKKRSCGGGGCCCCCARRKNLSMGES